METAPALFEYLLRLGDDRLVLGHRLSEWCGHGPILEEDIALSNLALDFVGQANGFLGLAGQVEGAGRDADALAFLRDALEFRNLQLVEQPNGDFGKTIARQFLFSAFDVLLLERLIASKHEALAGIAAKAFKEARYHLRHSGEWVLRLGDGTAESHRRVAAGFDALWGFTAEMFENDEVDLALIGAGIAPDLGTLQGPWRKLVEELLTRATLPVPSDDCYMSRGSRRGLHTEHLGHMLAEMQVLQRTHPGAAW